jgi:molybdopterin synthase sulfur carrier subunit
MPQVQFTPHLKRFFPELAPIELDVTSVAELVRALDEEHPGIAAYLVDDRGALRPHVNVFVDDEMVADRLRLSDPLDADSQVFILQALSGG